MYVLLPGETNRYHLYISYACPWASRCLSALYLKRLDGIIGLSVLHPLMRRTRPDDEKDTHTGWTFVDPATTPSLSGPTSFGSYSSKDCTPDPRLVREMHVRENRLLGAFALGQEDKHHRLERFRGHRAYAQQRVQWSSTTPLSPTYLPVWIAPRGFYRSTATSSATGSRKPTLVRFDEVYAVANKKLIEQYPNLSDSTSGSSIYQLPRMAETVNLQHVKIHYYGSHTHMNPFGIIPTGPNIDFTRPHDRDRFTNAILPAFE
ncbi:hypothetical protein PF007_g11263 [Phytophthora fragariae]|uniref:GST N-terminal domain-containing protein n=1 Tax=Phytophthora fragariae TaxID=53985 RepID=A0A6A3S8G4_9STRA|nr:hypothetical protein PF007_g11263 [Phytophthora fragariae]